MRIFLALVVVMAMAASAVDCATLRDSNIIYELRKPENDSKEGLLPESEFRKIHPLRHRVLHKLIPRDQRGPGVPALRATVEYEFDLISSNNTR